MKKIAILLAICTGIIAGCNFRSDSENKSITIRKTDAGYKFTAEYPKRKTAQVIDYINKTLNEDKLLADPFESKDSNISLGDSVRFHLVSEPGYVEINFKKMNNSITSYQKLEKMCVGIKEVLN